MLWQQAVDRANSFLASSLRRTLPSGSLLLDAGGMQFVTDEGTWPLRVRCTTWGNLCVRMGYAAQERTSGFVVGVARPERDPRVDNSLLRNSDGESRSPDRIATLILHEATHVVYREGTVGFWNTLAYYAEAIFLLRSASHSAERKAHATSEEFAFFALLETTPEDQRSYVQPWIEEHLSGGHGKNCRHGPFLAPPAPVRR